MAMTKNICGNNIQNRQIDDFIYEVEGLNIALPKNKKIMWNYGLHQKKTKMD
jgi:hypothetical protein